MKHIKIQHHYIKEKVQAMEIQIFFIFSTTTNRHFHKPLGLLNFKTCKPTLVWLIFLNYIHCLRAKAIFGLHS
jgi:hypothetical protein